jgi:hypothetical protein
MQNAQIPAAIAECIADLPDGLGITDVMSRIPFQLMWNFAWAGMGQGLAWNAQDNQRSVSHTERTAIVHLKPARLLFEITPRRISFYLVAGIADRTAHTTESIHIHGPGGEMEVEGPSEFPIDTPEMSWLLAWVALPRSYTVHDR